MRWGKEEREARKRMILGCNSDIYSRVIENLRPLHSLPTSEREKKAQQLVNAFKGHKANALNLAGPSPMPTIVAQAVINRMQNEILADTIAQQVCEIGTVRWGERAVIGKKTRTALTIYRIGELGGQVQELRYGGNESTADLGIPTIYSTAEFAIPVFDLINPMRYLQELEDLATWAAQDLLDKIDERIWTILDNNIAATWVQADVFSFVGSRVQDLPAGNDIDISAESGETADVFSRSGMATLMLHGQRMHRRLQSLFIPTLKLKDLWKWVDSNATTSYYPRMSEALIEEIERTGGSILTLWGHAPVRVTPTNVLDGDAATVYGRAFYEPVRDRTAPRGAAFLYFAEVDENSLTSPLVYVGRRADGAGRGVFDFFVLQQGVLIYASDFQKPNWARFKIVSP